MGEPSRGQQLGGDFGADDQLGTLNYITESERQAAAREIREGRAFCLSLPLDLPGALTLNPRRKPPRLAPTCLGETPYINYPLSEVDPLLQDVLSDDQVLLSTQYSTQWDSLAHVGALFDADGDGVKERCYYNGHRADVDVVGAGAEEGHASYARRLSVSEMAKTPVQGRGVLIDFVRHFGTERVIVGRDLLEEVIAEQKKSRSNAGIFCCCAQGILKRFGICKTLLIPRGWIAPVRFSTARTPPCTDGSPTARSRRLLRIIMRSRTPPIPIPTLAACACRSTIIACSNWGCRLPSCGICAIWPMRCKKRAQRRLPHRAASVSTRRDWVACNARRHNLGWSRGSLLGPAVHPAAPPRAHSAGRLVGR